MFAAICVIGNKTDLRNSIEPTISAEVMMHAL